MFFHDLYLEKVAANAAIKRLAKMDKLPKGISADVAKEVADYRAGQALGAQIAQRARLAQRFPGLAEQAMPIASLPGRVQGQKQVGNFNLAMMGAKKKVDDFLGKFETNATNMRENPGYLRAKSRAKKVQRAVMSPTGRAVGAGLGAGLALGGGALLARRALKARAAKQLRNRLMIAGGAGAGALALGGGLAASRR